MIDAIYNWLDDLRYYQFKDNWSSHPWIAYRLCSIGRHDYEFSEPIFNHFGKVVGGKLICMPCGKTKHSYHEVK